MSDESAVSENGDDWSREREWVIEADDEIVNVQLMRVLEDYEGTYKHISDEHVVNMSRDEHNLTLEEFDFEGYDENDHQRPIFVPTNVHGIIGNCALYKVSGKRCTLRIIIYRNKKHLREYWSSFFTAIERRFDAVGIEYRPLLGPDEALIAEALRRGEGQGIEFKQEKPKPDKLAKEIAAFATSNAGRIFLGITNNGRVVGLEKDQDDLDRDKLGNYIDNICSNNVRPPITVRIKFVEWDGVTVCVISVPKGLASIYYVNNIPYIRRGSQARPADPAEVEAIYAHRYTQGRGSQ